MLTRLHLQNISFTTQKAYWVLFDLTEHIFLNYKVQTKKNTKQEHKKRAGKPCDTIDTTVVFQKS